MNKMKLFISLFALFNIACNLTSCEKKSKEVYQEQDLILGDWSGVLDIGVMKINTALHIQKKEDGTLFATLDNLSVKTMGIPMDFITFEEGSLQFEMAKSSLKFEGTLLQNEKKISGRILQNGQQFSLVLERGLQAIEQTKRPQEPKAPYPYQERFVSYENVEAGVSLSGTLTLPSSQGPFPAVLLIAGSGPQDRNEEVFGHKPFLVLADHFTRSGIAVLRVDKRGCGKSSGNYDTATTQDFAEDAKISMEYLKTIPEIDPSYIGLMGHSEGGLIAPMVAAQSEDVAFLILAAGPAASGDEILQEQTALLLQANGESKETIEELNAFQKKIFAILKKTSDEETLRHELDNITQIYSKLPKEVQKPSILSLLNNAPKLSTPWFRFFLNFDPSKALEKVQIPVLAIYGELDLQVSSKQNIPIISEAFKKAKNKDFQVLELPKLNHLFQNCQTGQVTEYQTIEETISPSALKLISDWILERTSPSKKI